MNGTLLERVPTRHGLGLNLFRDEDLDKIHCATLEVMRETGVRVDDDEAMEIFNGGGCAVDKSTQLVKFPEDVVEEAIHSAPNEIALPGRNPDCDRVIGGNRVVFANYAQPTMVVDPFSGERRNSTKQDVANIALLCDALSEIDVVHRPVVARDTPSAVSPLHEMEALLMNTSKHVIHGPASGELARRQLEMAAAVVGGREEFRRRPILSLSAVPKSPLTLGADCCATLIQAVTAGAPCNVVSMIMAGASGPVTLAGSLIQHNAEILSGIVLAQLIRKGAPVVYGSATTIMDLRGGTAPVGSPELALFGVAIAQLVRHYGLPSYAAGGWVDSKVPDAQAGHEATLTAILPAMAGANLICGIGVTESGMIYDLSQLVIGNEILKMIKTVMKGVDVDEESMALDVIKQVGPGGDFLSQDHTLKHMRKQSYSRLIDRTMWETWENAGRKDFAHRAHEEVLSILGNHKPDPLLPRVHSTLRSMVEAAERDLA